jgi:nucleoside-diphosphate-sugar epimerase
MSSCDITSKGHIIMRIFVTGASGFIGSAVVPELLQAGHRVVGLARSDQAAARVAATGADVRRGDLYDTAGLAEAAADSDGVVHLGYSHDFSKMAEAAVLDRAAIGAMGTAMEGSGRPLLFASGVLGLAVGRVATEDDAPDPDIHPRGGTAVAAAALADRGVRPVAVRFAPTVHGAGDHGFVAVLTQVASERGVSAYVGDGASRWPAVHRSDAARLVRLTMENDAAGAAVHAVAEEGVPTRAIAEAIGHGLGLPVESVAPEQAAEHFGWIGAFFAADLPVSSNLTRERLGWEPTGPTLLEDLAAGHYFGAP